MFFFNYFYLMTEGSGSGTQKHMDPDPGPTNKWILWIRLRIRNTVLMIPSALVSSFFISMVVGVPEEETPLGCAELLHDTPEPGDQRGVAVHSLTHGSPLVVSKWSTHSQNVVNTYGSQHVVKT